jgi:hypothetical protein
LHDVSSFIIFSTNCPTRYYCRSIENIKSSFRGDYFYTTALFEEGEGTMKESNPAGYLE